MELALGFILIVVFLELRERKLADKQEKLAESILVCISSIGTLAGKVTDLQTDFEKLSKRVAVVDVIPEFKDELFFIREKLTEILKEAERVEKFRSERNDHFDIEV